MSDNRSYHSMSRNSDDSERSTLLPLLPDAEVEFDPTEIADDPVAAESFNIEKRFLSVTFEKVNSPNAVNYDGIQTSDDSFDWLEDDKDLYEITKGLYTGPPVTLKSKSSLYDNVEPDNPQSIRLEESRFDFTQNELEESESHSLLPKKLYYVLILVVQMLLLSVSALSLFGDYNFGSFAGLPLYYWSLLGSLVVFVPFMGSWSL